VLSVEHRHIPEGKDALIAYMEQQNYSAITELNDKVKNEPLDVIFALNTFIPHLNLNYFS
jgi:hypothetical protein